MSTSSLPKELVQQVMALDDDQREQLALLLCESVHPPGESVSPEEWKNTWVSACLARSSGKGKSVEFDDVMQRLTKILDD